MTNDSHKEGKSNNSSMGTLIAFIAAGLIIGVAFIYFIPGFMSESNSSPLSMFESKSDIEGLSVEDEELVEIESERFYKGIIKNTSNKNAKNIKIRLDFSEDTITGEVFDTRFIIISEAAANGAYTFNERVADFTTEKEFKYTTVIESAER